MVEKKLLTIGEAADFLGVSIQTLRRWDLSGNLKSIRLNPKGNRYYNIEDLRLMLNDLSKLAWEWVSKDFGNEPAGEFYCATSDIFGARLDKMMVELERKNDFEIDFSLIVFAVGEIGNNSYDHNLGNWPDIPGIFFGYDLIKKQIVIADRGRGVLETLKNVRPGLGSHKEALSVAFSEIITGRFPERRGNGLKSVRHIISSNSIELMFKTGDAQLNLNRGNAGLDNLNIIETQETFHGCYAVLKFK